jgi:phosphoglycerol transferase MdoB-like AlkP superfamily enzyme
MTRFRNSVYYTDKALGSFLDWAKSTEWWDNTLFIIVADHCRRNSEMSLSILKRYSGSHALAWRCPEVRDMKIEKTGSQVDIPLTLLHQLDLDDSYPFGKDILSDRSHSFAFYTFNEGFGFITDSSRYIYDHKPGKPSFPKAMILNLQE